jgi:hypothetical protein
MRKGRICSGNCGNYGLKGCGFAGGANLRPVEVGRPCVYDLLPDKEYVGVPPTDGRGVGALPALRLVRRDVSCVE